MFAWLRAGQPDRDGTSAAAEGGAVRPDPRPQPAHPSRLRVAPRPQEAAPTPGEPGQREGAGSHHALRQNTAAATGVAQRAGAHSRCPPHCVLTAFFSVIDPHAVRDGTGEDEADASERAGRQRGGAGGCAQVLTETSRSSK